MSPLLGRRLLLGVLLPLALLGIAETALRLLGFDYQPPEPPIILTNTDRDAAIEAGIDLFERSPVSLWQLRAGAQIPTLYEGTPAEHIGPWGFRGHSRETFHSGSPRIACLGDSSTYGVWVPEQDTMPAQLERRLREQLPQARVLNAGCVGFTVLQGAETFRQRLRGEGVDVVVLTFGCINESLPCKIFDDVEKLERLREEDSAGHRLLQGIMQLRLAKLLRFVLPPKEPANLMEWLERRGFHILDEEDRRRGTYPQRVPAADFRQLLTGFVRELRQHDVGVILVSPSRLPRAEEKQPFLGEYNEHIAAIAEAEQVPFLDLHTLLRQHPAGVEALHIPNDPVHPNADGHALWAEGLVPLVRGLVE